MQKGRSETESPRSTELFLREGRKRMMKENRKRRFDSYANRRKTMEIEKGEEEKDEWNWIGRKMKSTESGN